MRDNEVSLYVTIQYSLFSVRTYSVFVFKIKGKKIEFIHEKHQNIANIKYVGKK